MAPRRVNRGQQTKIFTLPAPIGGLNGRDGLAAMPATDAYHMDNWFPGTGTVDSRKGYEPHLTGLAVPVESLEVYAGGATQKLLAFADGSIYDASTAGAVGAALKSGLNSSVAQTAMFSNAGAQYLLTVTGADTMFAYDGSNFSNMTITGLTGAATNLSNIFAFKGRVYLVQKEQLGFYYLAVGAIQGAASYFDLSQVAKKGGYLMAMASVSIDAGDGIQDFALFITSEGECILYAGYDPSSSANWTLVGRYYTAPPIGRKCAFEYGADLIIITVAGAIPFSAIKTLGERGSREKAITAKLGKRLAEFNANRDVQGWHAVHYPRGGMLLLNVPGTASPAGEYFQFVMNTETGNWCRFTGLDALCWAVFEERIYFGTYTGGIHLADEGREDNGAAILCDARQAYNYFEDGSGVGSQNKQFDFAKIIAACDGQPPLSAAMSVDYREDQPAYVNNPIPDDEGLWDVSTWDETSWSEEENTQVSTLSLGKYGMAGSLRLRASLEGVLLKWYATQVLFKKAKGVF